MFDISADIAAENHLKVKKKNSGIISKLVDTYVLIFLF